MGTHRVRPERACGDRRLTGRIQTVLEVRDLRTPTGDVTMIRPPASARTGTAVMRGRRGLDRARRVADGPSEG